jgi:hypothetical protein
MTVKTPRSILTAVYITTTRLAINKTQDGDKLNDLRGNLYRNLTANRAMFSRRQLNKMTALYDHAGDKIQQLPDTYQPHTAS